MRLAFRSSSNAARSASGLASGVSEASKRAGSFWKSEPQSMNTPMSGKNSRHSFAWGWSVSIMCRSCSEVLSGHLASSQQ